ncbi:hypothetical protein ACFPPD_04175 [Cohnella suwonensis]|uniref:Uncharacterized protein n=1 Tax=Cohnella suwonensis TaxID=696072 RepID=A0ABW0LQ31_9BACL
MKNRIQPWFAVVLAFMAIGVATSLFRGSTQSWLVPVALIAIVYLLYKFPPNLWRAKLSKPKQPARKARPDFRRTNAKSERRRNSTFTVIEGRKDKDDEPPRYH